MPLPIDIESIDGAQELFDWFGYWPDFHDAQIVQFKLALGAPIGLTIQTGEMTNQVDASGSTRQRNM